MTEPDTTIFSPSTTISSSEEAYEAIRRAILDGTLRPGERIVEQRLARMLAVSRTPVREALHKLERENLVARSGRGMAVQTFSPDEVRDIYDLRAHLESYAARRAADRITEHEIAELRAVQEQLAAKVARDVSDDVEWLREPARLNHQFHLLVVRAARSGSLERTVGSVGQTPLIYKAYLWYGDDEKRRSGSGHETLIDLLAAGDGAGAEATWRAHIEFGRDVLIERLLAQRSRADAGF
ncbi:GntR family transcriptional regulator [Baekduia soli]|uniref:GntR family transcriptional regulator n=1 Tax=Baekduia soli TaxID=496014 RepID=A0A5B8U5Q7_9ACTN|nr:GntR family transcriptional regulator [Baekduia soli]QEC48424.1 GntR family transcriptional regulator [Baekduia soli]